MMKKKRIALLSLCTALIVAVAGFAASAFAAYTSGWSTKTSGLCNGGSVVVGDETWTVGGYNKDYYRGMDDARHFAVENVASEPSYKGGSNKKLYLDDLNLTFRIENESGTLAEGAHFAVGLGKTEFSEPSVVFVFEMQSDATFDMYLMSEGYMYEGDGAWGHNAGKACNVLSNLRDSAGAEKTLAPGMGDEFRLEVKYLSAAERAQYGLQHAGFAAYALFVNDYAFFYLPNTDNKFYCVEGNTLPQDQGKYYGYMTVAGNASGEVTPDLPTPAEIAALEGNVTARLTFTEISSYRPVPPENPTELAEWTDRKNAHGTATVEGTVWTGQPANYPYYVGIDEEGNFAVDYVAGDPQGNHFKGGSDKKVYIDGFSASFKIQNESTTLAPGAHLMLGISPAASEQGYAKIGLVFEMGEDGYFDLYVTSDHFLFNGGGIWNQNGAGQNVLANLRNASGEPVNLKLGLNDEITVGIRKMSAAERAQYGLEHPEIGDAYGLFVNGNCYYALSGTKGLFYTINDEEARWNFPSDASGADYGYLSVFGNFSGEVIERFPTPSAIDAMAATQNVRARLTFTDLVCDGTGAMAKSSSSEPREGFVVTDESDYTYGTVVSGPFAGAVALYAGTKPISYRTAATADLTGFEYRAAFKDRALFDAEAVPAKAVFTFLSGTESGAPSFTVTAVRSGASSLTLTSSVGEGSLTLDYDFKNSREIAVGAFALEDGKVIVTADGYPVAEGALDAAFVEKKGYLAVSSTFERVLEIGLTMDGTAVKKPVATALGSTFGNQTVACGAGFDAYPATCELVLDDGRTVSVPLTWDESIILPDAPGIYTVTGDFGAEAYESYVIGESVKKLLTFTVSVEYPEGYVKFLSTEYNKAGYTWQVVSNLENYLIYKKADGVDYFMPDGYASQTKYMPMDKVKKDIDGYSVDLTVKRHAGNPYLVFGMMPELAHINGNARHLSLGISFATDTTANFMVYKNDTYINPETGAVGEAEFAVFANGEEKVSGQNFPFDWTGETSYRIAFRQVGDQIYMDFVAGDKTYEVRKADGVTPKTVDASVYQDGKGYALLWSETGYNEITLKQNFTRYATGYTKAQDTIVDFGSEHGLPATSTLTLNDGTTVQGVITYTGEYDKEKAGTYTLTGKVTYEGELSLGNGETIWEDVDDDTFKVTVIVREEVRTVTEIDLPADFSVEYGANPSWPSELEVSVYSAYTGETTKETVQVNFVSEGFNRFKEGKYSFTVSLVGSYDLAEDLDCTVEVTVLPEENPEPETPGGCGGCNKGDASAAGALALILGAAVACKKFLK